MLLHAAHNKGAGAGAGAGACCTQYFKRFHVSDLLVLLHAAHNTVQDT